MTTRSTLWELSAELQQFAAELEESGGELTEGLERKIDILHPQWTEKVEACCHVMDELAARREMLKQHVDRLTSAVRRLERARKGLRDYVQFQHQAAGKKRTVTATHIVSIQNNSAPTVVISDWDSIPEQFRKVKESPDTTAIKNAIVAGSDVPGALLEYGQHLRTRVGATAKEQS